ncbi:MULTISPECIES: SDR family NAD(P)-dependent oxidoreductase [unclassified Kitasatospora]|uniref:SDR family NAD(P)-dependent oxidoreductase n=1 Tax=unclassified Kitasatospora TaxID=2633591 RepID=UPI00340C0FC9
MTTAPEQPLALITGGTRGIGLAIARELGSRGHRVFICARTAQHIDQALATLRGEGHQADGLPCDVRDPRQVAELIRHAVAEHGPISVLVNNAGRTGGGPTATTTDDLWYDVIDTNLNAVFLVTRETLRHGHITSTTHPRIINIASTAGKQAVTLGAPYTASKHAVIGFTRALAKELAPTGTTVNAICPGYVQTPHTTRIHHEYATAYNTTPETIHQHFRTHIPLGRYTTPEEVASLAGYLTTPTAASITAQALNVCGGLATQ